MFIIIGMVKRHIKTVRYYESHRPCKLTHECVNFDLQKRSSEMEKIDKTEYGALCKWRHIDLKIFRSDIILDIFTLLRNCIR